MTSFKLKVAARRRAAVRLVGEVSREVLSAFEKEKRKSGISQSSLARRLGVDRSVVHRNLLGGKNFTLETLSDLAWAMNRRVRVTLDEAAGADAGPRNARGPEFQTESATLSGAHIRAGDASRPRLVADSLEPRGKSTGGR